MRCARWLCLVFLMSVPVVAFAGDIQVSCEPGLRVYLDDEFAGLSNARQDGFFLLDVTPGNHNVRVEKDGFLSQSFQVRVKKLPVEVKVEVFTPVPTPVPGDGKEDRDGTGEAAPPDGSGEEEVRQLVGRLLITSAPQNCEVEIDGTTQAKTSPQLSIGSITSGTHTVSFRKPGYEPISGVVEVQPGAEVNIRGNLIAGKVDTIHMGLGSLRVISKPIQCTIRFMGKSRKKTASRLNLGYIPAGEHQLIATWRGREVSSRITIMDDTRTIVNLSFMSGDEPIQVIHEPLNKVRD